MLFIRQNPSPKYASLPAKTAIEIVSHKLIDQRTIFTYSIPITIDQSIINNIDGQLQIRGLLSQKRPGRVVVKKSSVVSGNILKDTSRQRLNQIADRNLKKQFFFKDNLANSDLSQPVFDFKTDISLSDINTTFIVEIALIRENGTDVVIDSLEIDHAYALRRYDLISQDFVLTTTRMNDRKIYASAVSNDDIVGSFKFYLRNNASTNFLPSTFENVRETPLNFSNEATVEFDVPDSEQSYTIVAKPVTKFYKQEMANYRQVEAGFVKNIKYLPFYMERITDREVAFRIHGIDQSIDKVFLYRQMLPSGNRSFVASQKNVLDNIYITDPGRNSQYDFIYTLDYLDSNGVMQTSPSEVIIPGLKLDTLASLTVNRIKDQGELSESDKFITFNATVDYKTTTIVDQITKDLKKMGLESLLSSELEKTTNNLKPLIRLLVSQISLINGVEYDVGVYEPGVVQVPINDLSRESIYRFEVAVRSVPEALETVTAAQNLIASNASNLKSEVDLASKSIGNKVKSGRTSFSAKFFTKSSLRGSLLRYGDASDLGDTTYYSGRTGIFYDIKISSPSLLSTSIRNVSFISSSKGNFVRWGYSGDSRNLNYFELNIDGNITYSFLTQEAVQIFYIGNKRPNRIEITPIVNGIKNTGGKGKIEVQ
jgi:hypothetical protein